MTTRAGSALGHELALCRSREGIVDLLSAFVDVAAAARRPTLLLLTPETGDALRSERPELPDGVETSEQPVRRPASDLRRIQSAASSGGASIGPTTPEAATWAWVVREAAPGSEATWREWLRYEAATNTLLAEYHLYLLCVYHEEVVDPAMRQDLERTHPVLLGDGDHLASGRFEAPTSVLGGWPDRDVEPREPGPPAVELIDPKPTTARSAVGSLALRAGVDPEAVDQLVLAVSEVVTNALLHGQPPVALRAWAGDRRVVTTVTDAGPGPSDPHVGLVPARSPAGAPGETGGLGLWITHQVVDVTHRRHAGGYTIRLVAGRT